MKKSLRWFIWDIPLVILVLAVGMIVWRVDLATVRLPRSDYRLLAARALQPGEFVSLSYRHSVELTQVEGRFILGPGPEILASQTRMASVGTGLPNAYPERTSMDGDTMVIDEQNRPVDVVRFFLMPINKTRLSLAGHEVDLSGVRPGSVIQIAAERVMAWQWLGWKLLRKPWNYGLKEELG